MNFGKYWDGKSSDGKASEDAITLLFGDLDYLMNEAKKMADRTLSIREIIVLSRNFDKAQDDLQNEKTDIRMQDLAIYTRALHLVEEREFGLKARKEKREQNGEPSWMNEQVRELAAKAKLNKV